MKERKFWFEVAKRESHFINDRYIDQSSLIEPVPEVSTESVA
jgi:hypothetical protein